MTCKLAQFYASETLLWYPFQRNHFGKLHCKELQINMGQSSIISHVSRRMNIEKNWRNCIYDRKIINTQINQHTIHIDPVHSEFIVTACKDGIIEWEISSSEQTSVFKIDTGCDVFHVNKEKYYVASKDNIFAYDRINKNQIYSASFVSNVNVMEISEKYLFCGLWDGSIKTLDSDYGSVINSFNGHNFPVYCLSSQKQIFASGSSDRLIKIWEIGGKQLTSLTGHSKTVTDVQITKDLSQLFSSSKDHLVRLWDIQQTQCISEFHAHEDAVNCIYWRGDILVSAGADRKILLWDIRQPDPIHTLDVHKNEIISMEIDERKICSYSTDRSLITCDFDSIL